MEVVKKTVNTHYFFLSESGCYFLKQICTQRSSMVFNTLFIFIFTVYHLLSKLSFVLNNFLHQAVAGKFQAAIESLIF